MVMTKAKTKKKARAYVLLHTVQGCSGDVVSSLLQNSNVISVDRVEGPTDVVAIMEAPTRPQLATAVVAALSKVDVMIDSVDLLPV
jgi:hypothetical protein